MIESEKLHSHKNYTQQSKPRLNADKINTTKKIVEEIDELTNVRTMKTNSNPEVNQVTIFRSEITSKNDKYRNKLRNNKRNKFNKAKIHFEKYQNYLYLNEVKNFVFNEVGGKTKRDIYFINDIDDFEKGQLKSMLTSKVLDGKTNNDLNTTQISKCVEGMKEDTTGNCTLLSEKSKECAEGFWRCNDGSICIPENLVCSGLPECYDLSDEAIPPCSK